MGTNKCIFCGETEYLIATYPRRLKAMEKGVAKPLAPPLSTTTSKPATIGRAYIMRKKEASIFGIVVTRTLFLNSKPVCVLFDSDAMHCFMHTRTAL